jgi:hypothetical protein
MPFFPNQYNEDWFFFSALVAERSLGLVGTARQAPYDPYADPNRAREEEFGDLLAEGMYALFAQQSAEMKYFDRLDAADEAYWGRFIEARWDMLSLTALSLEVAVEYAHDADRCAAALGSLGAAQYQLSRLSPRTCADYVDAWVRDLREWQQVTQRLRSTGRTADVLSALGLENWRPVDRKGRRTVTTTASPSGVPAQMHRRATSSNFACVRAPGGSPA